MKDILYKTCFNYFQVEYFLKKANFSIKDRVHLVLPFRFKLKRNDRKDTLFKIGGIKDGTFFFFQNTVERIVTFIEEDFLQKAPKEYKELELSEGIFELTVEEWNTFPTDPNTFDVDWHKRFKKNRGEPNWIELGSPQFYWVHSLCGSDYTKIPIPEEGMEIMWEDSPIVLKKNAMQTLFALYAGNSMVTDTHVKIKVKWEHYLVMLPYYFIETELSLGKFEYLNQLLEQRIGGDHLETLLELYGE